LPVTVRGGGNPTYRMAFVPKGEWARHLGASPRMRMTASWSGSSGPPNTSLRRENSRLWRAPLGTCCPRLYQLPVFATGALDSPSARLQSNRRRHHKKDHDAKSHLTEIAPYKPPRDGTPDFPENGFGVRTRKCRQRPAQRNIAGSSVGFPVRKPDCPASHPSTGLGGHDWRVR
jgi:hypothetical protein